MSRQALYQLRISARVSSELKKIPKQYQTAIRDILKELPEDPFWGKQLTRALTGKRSLKVGVYRIIYTIDYQNKIIKVTSAGHRAKIYQ